MKILIELIDGILEYEGSYFEIEVFPWYADTLRQIKGILEVLLKW